MKKINLIAIAMGLATSISCFAQGGGSVNGPDLKGGMIPVYSDGEIPTEKLNGALDICYKRMGAQVLGTILGRETKLNASQYPTNDSAFPDSTPAPISKNEHAINYIYSTDSYLSPSIVIQKEDTIRIRPQNNDLYSYAFEISASHPIAEWGEFGNRFNLSFVYSFRNSINYSDYKGINLVVRDFPFISYELKDKSIYGELGELIEKKFFVSNIKFNYKPGSSDTTFQLKSLKATDQTEIDTPLKVDSLDLIECIKSNLAN